MFSALVVVYTAYSAVQIVLYLHLIMLHLRRVKFYKPLLYNCSAFLCDLFFIIYCRIFVMMTCLVMFFGQSVMQLNVYGL